MKIAICDDDKNYIDDITQLLNEVKCEIFSFTSGVDLIKSPLLSSFDLIFLDIVMKKMDGVETLQHLAKTSAYIIFMSTTSDRLRELFNKNVLGFLDKPIKKDAFFTKLDEFLKLKANIATFSFEKQGITHTLRHHEILYFENLGHYIHLHTNTNVFVFKANISRIWQLFENNPCFAMPNRSFIVNLKFSSLMSKNTILVNDTVVSIGRTRKEDTHNRLLFYACEKGI